LTHRQYFLESLLQEYGRESLKPSPWLVQLWLLQASQRQVWQQASQVPLLEPLPAPSLEQQQVS
jgi:hypothetical protein